MSEVSSKLDAIAYVFAPLLLEGQVGLLDTAWPLKTENRPAVYQHADRGLEGSAHRN